MPVVAQEKALGVLAVRNPDPGPVREELRDLLAALPGNIALVLERERLSEENARNKAAGESARLAKILLHHISHELRTPLTTIKGAVSGLLDSGPDDDPELRAAMLAETIVAADTLNVVVEDLLAMSRLEAGRLVPRTELTYLNELLGAALGSLGMDLDGRSIVLDPGVADLEIKADPALVTQVFRNVLRNFAAYTPAGSRLLIGAGGQGEDCAIWFSDNGPGVPEEELPLLFDTFYRGSRCQARQGCGLGLSICKGIVEAHRGSVQATRSAEGGLRMEILLPRGSEP